MAKTPKNAQRGQTVTIGETTYPLVYDYEALCFLCDEVGATVSNMQQVMGNLAVSQMHLMLWAGMLDAHPELKPDDVRALLKKEEIADAQAIVMAGADAFNAAMARVPSDASDPPTPTAATDQKSDGTTS